MDFSLLLSSYATVWSNPEVLLMTFIGALGGVLLGAIPGMTATMGVALLIPFSFGMDLIPSIGLLLGIYCGGMYGGSISAITLNTPGTNSAIATGDGITLAHVLRRYVRRFHFRYPHPRPRHARRSRHPAGRLPHV